MGKLLRSLQELEYMTSKRCEDKIGGVISENAFTVLTNRMSDNVSGGWQRTDSEGRVLRAFLTMLGV